MSLTGWAGRKAAVRAIMAKIGAGLAGPVTFVLSLFIDKLLSYLQEAVSRWIKQKEQDAKNDELKKIDAEKAKEYKQVIGNPNSTEKEIEDASLDFLNSGRK
jgi:hypothetical protein